MTESFRARQLQQQFTSAQRNTGPNPTRVHTFLKDFSNIQAGKQKNQLLEPTLFLTFRLDLKIELLVGNIWLGVSQ